MCAICITFMSLERVELSCLAALQGIVANLCSVFSIFGADNDHQSCNLAYKVFIYLDINVCREKKIIRPNFPYESFSST